MSRAREAAQRVGALMRDRPQRPSQEVAWWAGYLMRTGGAKHLRSPALDLTWWVFYITDKPIVYAIFRKIFGTKRDSVCVLNK